MKKKFKWKNYITVKALPTTKKVKFIDKKEFAVMAINKNIMTFIRYIITLLVVLAMEIYLFCLTKLNYYLLKKLLRFCLNI